MLEKILGGSSALRDENIAIYLASIERKTNSLLAMYAYVTAEVCRFERQGKTARAGETGGQF